MHFVIYEFIAFSFFVLFTNVVFSIMLCNHIALKIQKSLLPFMFCVTYRLLGNVIRVRA